MSIHAVIFDFGGVLVRTAQHGPRTRLAERYGMTYEQIASLVFDTESSHRATLGEIPAREHWEYVCRQLNYPVDKYMQLFYEFYGGDLLDLGLVNFIRSLRPRYCTALLSNAHDDLRQQLTNRWNIMDAFEQVFISAEMGLRKPDARIYQAALKRLEVAPEETIFVDDFVENIEAACSLGIQAVQFNSTAQAQADVERLLKGE